MEITIAIIVWLVTGAIAYSSMFAYSQKEWPLIAKECYRDDLGFSLFFGFMPIAGFVAATLMTGFYKHGFKFY